MTELNKAAQLNPDVPSLQSYVGQALLFTGDADGAVKAFRKELAGNPNDYRRQLPAGFDSGAAGRRRGSAAAIGTREAGTARFHGSARSIGQRFSLRADFGRGSRDSGGR